MRREKYGFKNVKWVDKAHNFILNGNKMTPIFLFFYKYCHYISANPKYHEQIDSSQNFHNYKAYEVEFL